MNISIDRNSKVPVYLQVTDGIKKLILSGELAAGQKLPSIRVMADILHLHRNTVAKVYSELEAEGLIVCTPGRSCKVRDDEPGEPGISPENEIKRKKKVNWLAEINDEYLDMKVTFDDLYQRVRRSDGISMASGIASPDIYDKSVIVETFSSIIFDEEEIQDPRSPYKGDEALRQSLIPFLARKGIHASIGNIQIMPGLNQALNFVIALLVQKEDIVIAEEPVVPDLYRMLELAGADIHLAPVDEDGMDCIALEKMIRQLRPKLIFLSSSYNNPTGNILPLARRKKIVDLSNQYRIPILEEDAASELTFRGPKLSPIKAFDTEENVIYLYSFYLTFIPGQALSFIVADKEVIKRLSYLISVRTIHVNRISQKLMEKYLSNGNYYTTLEKLRASYERKQEIVCSALDEMKPLGVTYRKPDGGVYIWCRLPAGVDSKVFVNTACRKGVTVIPGHVFYPRQDGGREYIRICYSFETEERLKEGMKILQEAIKLVLS